MINFSLSYEMCFVYFILIISIFGMIWIGCELWIIKYKEYKQKEIKMIAEEIYKLISKNLKTKSATSNSIK